MAKARSATLTKDAIQTGTGTDQKQPADYGKALNFRVPEEFFKYFKIAAAHRGVNQTELLMELCAPELRARGYVD